MRWQQSSTFFSLLLSCHRPSVALPSGRATTGAMTADRTHSVYSSRFFIFVNLFFLSIDSLARKKGPQITTCFDYYTLRNGFTTNKFKSTSSTSNFNDINSDEHLQRHNTTLNNGDGDGNGLERTKTKREG